VRAREQRGLGLLHAALGLPALRRAVERGQLHHSLAGPQLVNWLFSGGAMCLLGILLLLGAPELRRGRRSAWWSALLTGLFFLAVGVAAYVRVARAEVLVFAALGLLAAAPALLQGPGAFGER